MSIPDTKGREEIGTEERKEEEFNYSYTAPTEEERAKIERIRRRYLPKSPLEEKIEQLRRLDRKVRTPARLVGWAIGVAGLFVFGLGMALVLEWERYVWGVVVGAIGAACIAVAPVVHRAIYNRTRDKYADEIVALGEELLQK